MASAFLVRKNSFAAPESLAKIPASSATSRDDALQEESTDKKFQNTISELPKKHQEALMNVYTQAVEDARQFAERMGSDATKLITDIQRTTMNFLAQTKDIASLQPGKFSDELQKEYSAKHNFVRMPDKKMKKNDDIDSGTEDSTKSAQPSKRKKNE